MEEKKTTVLSNTKESSPGGSKKNSRGDTARNQPFLFEKELQFLKLLAEGILGTRVVRRQDLREILPSPGEETEAKHSAAEAPDLLPFVVLVQGKAGTGKTTLVRAFQENSAHRSFCYRLCELWLHPFSVLEDLFRDLLSLNREAVLPILKRHLWGLQGILPELGPRAPGQRRREEFFAACAQCLVEIAVQVPFVVIFEDIHLADPAFVTFLGFLARALKQRRAPTKFLAHDLKRRPPSGAQHDGVPRLLVLLSSLPPGNASDTVGESLQSLKTEPFTFSMVLPELQRTDLQRFLSTAGLPRVGNGAAQRLLQIVDHNPLLCALLVRLLKEQLGGERNGATLCEQAEKIAQSGIVLSLLKSLPPNLREILTLLALFGKPVEEETLRHFTEPEQVCARLADLHARGLLRRDSRGWYPASSSLRCDSQHLLAPTDRSKLHDAIAARIASEGPVEGQRAFAFFQHAVRGTQPLSALQAGIEAARFLEEHFAYQRSLVILYNLAGLLQAENPESPRLLEIRKAVVHLEEQIGRDNAAKQNLKRILQETPPELLPEDERALLTVQLAGVYQRQGRLSRAIKVLGRAFSRNISPEVTSRIYGAFTEVRLERGEAKRALNYCLRALSVLPSEAPELLRVKLRRLLARCYCHKGDYALGVDTLLQALEAHDLEKLGREAWLILDQLGQVYLEHGNYFRAARYLYRALEVKRAGHDISGMAATLSALGEVYARSGNFFKAIEQERRAAEIREVIGDWPGLGRNLINLGSAFLRLGHLHDAVCALREAVTVAEKSGRTEDLVAAFVSLAEAYLTLGDMKQAEEYLRQSTILAQEYQLQFYQAKASQLAGKIAALRRNWEEACQKLSRAQELYATSGSYLCEIDGKLDMAAAAYEREQYEEALKGASQAQVQAEELRSPSLVARSLLIKGTTYRHLSSGIPGKWRECLERALEVARSVADVQLHFEILYSLGRAHHDEQSFAEAESCYQKAGEILERIAATLPEEEATRFWNDKRRRIFREDSQRLLRESGARVPATAPHQEAELLHHELSPAAYEDLLGKIQRLNSFLLHENFFGQVLGLAADIARAERGCLVEVTPEGWHYVAYRGIRPEAVAGTLSYLETLVGQVIRQGKILETSGRDEEEKYGSRASLAGLRDRRAVLVPLRYRGETFAAVYLDRSLEGSGSFRRGARALLQQFAVHAAVAWHNRRTFLRAATYCGTSLLAESYFTHLVQEAVDQQKRGGNPFALLGVAFKRPLRAFEHRVLNEVHHAVGRHRPVGVLSDRALVVLVAEGVSPRELTSASRDVVARIGGAVPVASHQLLIPENLEAAPAEWLAYLRTRLDPSSDLLADMEHLAESKCVLREAKRILEKHVIQRALRQAHGNITRAAETLGIHRPQLSQLVRRHQLEKSEFTRPGRS